MKNSNWELRNNIWINKETGKRFDKKGYNKFGYDQDGYNKDEALITISKIIHAGRYNLSINSNIEKLSKFTNRTKNEIESSIRLVKRIEEKLNKDK